MKYIVVLFALMAVGCEEKTPTLNDVTSRGGATYNVVAIHDSVVIATRRVHPEPSGVIDEGAYSTDGGFTWHRPARRSFRTGFTVTNGDTSWHYTYE